MPLTVIKSQDEYLRAIKESGVSAVEFVAPWDESCKAISPKFQEYANNPRWSSMRFYKVDICDQQDVAMDAHVELAPTFHFYRDGAKVKEYVGSSYPALERTMGSVMNGQ
ncbi:thioredoxin-like protein [Rhodotorula diobovata]|uniref:Thioredoxin-like protein n=1 Tax=Rhodotorula diobovata TaxID=5288 RepID=A0A5C5FNC9_9BASI|nr:thioredoxin-like protein [Rhodotorula diobovata]TNY17361.1 thioredoxin-like protein [Rhodotorula diobovata]TNY17368.1 thioredoxin-like protein [Rhodotorula diobovata]TNY18028.1 thioredoxin-like protein [Rhodotorula diobovata]